MFCLTWADVLIQLTTAHQSEKGRLKVKAGKPRSLQPRSPEKAARSLRPPQHLDKRLDPQTSWHLNTDRTVEGKRGELLLGGGRRGQSVHQGREPSERLHLWWNYLNSWPFLVELISQRLNANRYLWMNRRMRTRMGEVAFSRFKSREWEAVVAVHSTWTQGDDEERKCWPLRK